MDNSDQKIDRWMSSISDRTNSKRLDVASIIISLIYKDILIPLESAQYDTRNAWHGNGPSPVERPLSVIVASP